MNVRGINEKEEVSWRDDCKQNSNLGNCKVKILREHLRVIGYFEWGVEVDKMVKGSVGLIAVTPNRISDVINEIY